jgi:hypothetical protein
MVRQGQCKDRQRRILSGLFLPVLLLVWHSAASAGRHGRGTVGPPKAQETYGHLPLAFEANQGQMDPRVKFLARGPGYTLFLKADEAVLTIRKSSATGLPPPDARNSKLEIGNSPFGARPTPPDAAVLRLRLVGANPRARAVGLNELPGKNNYFLGNDPRKWRANVPRYARVRCRDVYPGIDVVYYGSNQQQLEYDFMVAPGADPAAIALQVETGKWKNGNRKLENRNSKIAIGRQGNLLIATEAGEVRLHKPVVYQPRYSTSESGSSGFRIRDSELVDGRYVLTADKRIRFEIADYDPDRPLIIDPVLSYSSYLGGSGTDYAYGIAVDAAGSAYVTGYTNSPNFPAGNSAAGALNGGTCGSGLDTYSCYDVFVAKLNPAGTTLAYVTYLGGSGDDIGTGIAVDSFGNAYVTGYTNSLDLPTLNAAQPTAGGGSCGTAPTTFPCYDAFIAKLDSQDGEPLYCSYLGGSSGDYAQGIAVDSAGQASVTGFTLSRDFPTTLGAFQRSYGGSLSDAFVAKVNSAGTTLLYSTYLGGSGEDYGSKIRVDSAGAAYVAGYTNSSDFPTRNPFQAFPGGGVCGSPSSLSACFDAFVAKLNPQGSGLVYSTYLGGSGGDYGYGIAVDNVGTAFVTGLTTSTNFPVSTGAFQSAGGGNSVDAFVTKLDPTGSAMQYSTYFGGLGQEAGFDIAVGSLGNAYVTGYAYGSGLPVANPLQADNAGFYDAFLAKLNVKGTALIFSTYLGGSGNEKAQSVAVDSAGNAYVAGGTFSSDFPVTPEAVQVVYGSGAFDAFVAKLANIAYPILGLSNATVIFPAQAVGTTSPATAVTLTNAGDAPLALAGIDVTGDFAETSDCGAVVAPGNTCTLQITFTPTTLGPRSGEVSLRSNVPGSPQTIGLTGTGIGAPIVSLSSYGLAYADQIVGTVSASQTTTVSNTGSAPLQVSSVNLTGTSSGDFLISSDTCSAANVTPGTSCTIQAAFTPTAAGPRKASIFVVSNAPDSPHKAVLTGIGTSIRLVPGSLSFPSQQAGTTSSPQTVTLRNEGSAPVHVWMTAIGGGSSSEFSHTNSCPVPPATLAGRASCSLTVWFSPLTAGAKTAALLISHDGGGSPSALSLTGIGAAAPSPAESVSSSAPTPDAQPGLASQDSREDPAGKCSAGAHGASAPLPAGSLAGGLPGECISFGKLPVGGRGAPRVVIVRNPGQASINLTRISVSGPNRGDFEVINKCPASLRPRGSCSMGLLFTPQSPGRRHARLIVHLGTRGRRQIELAGWGF